MDMGHGEGVRRYQLTQGLPLASGNTAGTNGPSSELEEGIVSESSSTGDCLLLCLSYKKLMLPQPGSWYLNLGYSVCNYLFSMSIQYMCGALK